MPGRKPYDEFKTKYSLNDKSMNECVRIVENFVGSRGVAGALPTVSPDRASDRVTVTGSVTRSLVQPPTPIPQSAFY